MMTYVVAYGAAALVFCLLDYLWLAIIAKDFYKSQFGTLMAAEPNWGAAAAFYILYLVGLIFFAVSPAVREQNWLLALGLSAFLGLLAYASYDLTNLATLKGWTLTLTLVDITWGVVVSSAAGTAAYFAARAMERV